MAAMAAAVPTPRKVAHFLFSYRLTPQTTTDLSSSAVWLSHALSFRLYMSKPSCWSIRQCQSQQKDTHDCHAQDCQFQIGDRVLAKDYGTGESWLSGVIQNKTDPSHLLL